MSLTKFPATYTETPETTPASSQDSNLDLQLHLDDSTENLESSGLSVTCSETSPTISPVNSVFQRVSTFFKQKISI